jgi:hypothetical protein
MDGRDNMTAFYARAVHDACIAFRRMHTSGDYARWTTWGGFLAAPAGKDLGSLSREDMVYVPYPGMYCGYDWDAEACQGRKCTPCRILKEIRTRLMDGGKVCHAVFFWRYPCRRLLYFVRQYNLGLVYYFEKTAWTEYPQDHREAAAFRVSVSVKGDKYEVSLK